MLHRIIGPVGSGKRDALLQEIQAHFAAGRKIFVLVPEQNTAVYEGLVTSLCGPKSSLSVEVTNFSRLPNLVLREYGGLAGLAPTEAEKKLLLAQCVNTLAPHLTALKLHQEAEDIASLSAELESLSQAGLGGQALSLLAQCVSEQPAFSEKLSQTALLAGAWQKAVSARYRDPAGELERLASLLSEFPFFRDSAVFIDGFWDFTAPQEALIGRILTQAKEVFITFAARKREPLLFALPLRSAGRILRLARERGVEVRDRVTAQKRDGALGHLLAHLAAESVPYEGAPDGIRLVQCATLTDEAEFVADEILSLLRQGVARREIAVLSRDGAGEEILRLTLEEKGVPSFCQEKRPLGASPLARTVLLAVRFAQGMGNPAKLRSFLKNGLFLAPDRQRFCLERYCATWNLFPSALMRKAPLTANPRGYYAFTDADREELALAEAAKETVFRPLRRLAAGLLAGKVADRIGAIVAYLEECGASQVFWDRLRKAESRGDFEESARLTGEWNGVLSALSAFGRALGSEKVPSERFLPLLTLAFSGSLPGELPPEQDRVLIGRVGFARPDGVRFVFLMGLNAGVFPAPENKGGLFPLREKEMLRELGYPVTCGDDSLSRETFYFYLCAAFAADGLILSWHGAESSTEKASLSVLGKRVQTLFPQLIMEVFDPEKTVPKTEKDAFSRWAGLVKAGNPAAEAYRDYFLSHKDFSGKALLVGRAGGSDAFTLKQNLPYENRDLNMVYSRLETYTLCPFSFYAKYLLDAKAREKARLGANIAGSFVHRVLEEVLLSLTTQKMDFAAVTDGALEKENDRAVSLVLAESMGEDLPPSLSYLIGRLRESTLLILKDLREECRVSAFRPVFFEKSLEELDGVYRLPLKDGTSLCLFGTIDRVDLYENKAGEAFVRVVDYKTGGHDFSLTDVANGLDLQMLLYLFALWNQGFHRNGEKISPQPAGVLYLNGLGDRGVAENREEAKEAAENPFAGLGREGLVVENPELLAAQDPEGLGRFLPVAWSKGTGKGNLISLEKLGLMKRKVEGDFIRLASALKDGHIEALPLKGKGRNGPDPCRYCDYRALCKRKEEQLRPYRTSLSREELFGKEL